jgi:enoyl-[acyl-carrier-protein] reductase (NADH)
LEQFQKDFLKAVRPTSLLQRFAHTDEVANMVAFLSSPLSSATNGASVRADGGVVRTIA